MDMLQETNYKQEMVVYLQSIGFLNFVAHASLNRRHLEWNGALTGLFSLSSAPHIQQLPRTWASTACASLNGVVCGALRRHALGEHPACHTEPSAHRTRGSVSGWAFQS